MYSSYSWMTPEQYAKASKEAWAAHDKKAMDLDKVRGIQDDHSCSDAFSVAGSPDDNTSAQEWPASFIEEREV
jgi:hypothetical protein